MVGRMLKIFSLLWLLSAPPAAAQMAASAPDYGLWSLLPALLAIVMALITRQVLVSLFLGVWAGAWLIAGGGWDALGDGLLRVIDTHLLRALVPEDGSTDHMAIITFTLMTGGMIGIISRNGGLAGIVQWISRHADTARKGQLAATLSGMMVFFDDYANTLIVGNAMRPLTDRLKISREKLAWIVDSTAAPVASVALITTWIGFQVSLIDEAKQGIDGLAAISGYELMVQAIPYSFYSLLSLVFIFMVILSRRDFGPMLAAEERAQWVESRTSAPVGRVKTPELADPSCAFNALIPILVMIGTVVFGLFYTGSQSVGPEAGLTDILGNADPFRAMLWASLGGVIVAVILSAVRSPLSFGEIMEALEDGLAPMLGAAVILTLAWAIAGVNDALGTAHYLTELLGSGLNPHWLPAIIFLLAAAIAFATGTSWGVMAILVPLAIPLTWSAMENAGMTGSEDLIILHAAIASTLTGAVWGDHCSPISDTTILSSIASGCDHIRHVHTQLPYALTVGAVSLLAALIPAGFGLPWWGGIILAALLLWLLLRLVGKPAQAGL